MRTYGITRNNNDTKVSFSVNLDGVGKSKISTPNDFLNHMLVLFAKYSSIDLYVSCELVTKQYDDHRVVEDIALAFGKAFSEALGDRHHIGTCAHAIVPDEEALVMAVVDVSGSFYTRYDVSVENERIGGMSTELIEDFFTTFARAAGINLNLKKIYGVNAHHIIECTFKAAAVAIKEAVAEDEDLVIKRLSTGKQQSAE